MTAHALKGFALATLACIPVTARARTLDRAGVVRLALAQNPQIAAARAQEAASLSQQDQVSAARMPAISVIAGVGPSTVATLVPGTTAESVQDQYRNFKWSDLSTVWVADLAVIQPLYTFGKIALRGEAAEHGLLARRAETRMERADVAFAVAQLYEGYLYARAAERFFVETDHWLDSTLQDAEDKVAKGIGSANERDVLRLQAAKGLAALGLNQSRAGEAQARAGLVAYLGLPIGERLDAAEDSLLPAGRTPDDYADLARMARDNRPERTALQEGARALAALGRAEAAGLWPDLFAAAFLSVAYTPGRDWIQSRFIVDPQNHVEPGALLGLRWQLQGGMTGARAAEQHAHADVLARTGDWADQGIPAEVRKAFEDVHRADKDIEHGDAAVQKAKKWMVDATMDYDVGLLDIREVADAVDSYTTLRLAVLKAHFDRNVAMAALSKATGVLDGDSKILYLEPPATGTVTR